MDFDFFTYDESIADRLGDLLGKAVLVDNTIKPVCYSVLDVPFSKLREYGGFIINNSGSIEMRFSVGGDYFWPNKRFSSLEEAFGKFAEGSFYERN